MKALATLFTDYDWKCDNDATLKVVYSWLSTIQFPVKGGHNFCLGLCIHYIDTEFGNASNEIVFEKFKDILEEYTEIYKSSMFDIVSLQKYISNEFNLLDFKKIRCGISERHFGIYSLYIR